MSFTEAHFLVLTPEFFGRMISVNPSLTASSKRFWSQKTFLTTQVSDISPRNIRLSRGVFFLEEIIAAAVARSMPGSEIVSPRATLI